MAKREAYRRLMDKEGNAYYVSIPFDVNMDSMEDILLGMHQGIVKLQGYKLASEGVYRLPDTIETDGKQFTFHKKVDVYNEFPGLDPKDFSEAIQELLDRARDQRINRIEVTTMEGKPIKKDERGTYIEAAVKCHACGKNIIGRKPVSYSDGRPSRVQMFVADDPKVTRYAPGSKHKLCADCSVTSIPVPEHMKPTPVAVAEEVIAAPVKAPEPVLEKKGKLISTEMESDLRELLALSKHDSNVSLEYFKGMVYGVIKSLLK